MLFNITVLLFFKSSTFYLIYYLFLYIIYIIQKKMIEIVTQKLATSLKFVVLEKSRRMAIFSRDKNKKQNFRQRDFTAE